MPSFLSVLRARVTDAPRARARRSVGFTVLELLIVITVIGILAALALTKFRDAKDRTYVGAMQNDLKNYEVQQELYTTTHAGYANGPAALPDFHFSRDVGLQAFSNTVSDYLIAFQHAQTDKICELRSATGRVTCAGSGNDALPISASATTISAGQSVTFDASGALSAVGGSGRVSSGLAARATTSPIVSAATAAVAPADVDHISWSYGDGTFDIGDGTVFKTTSHTFGGDSTTYVVRLAITTKAGEVLAGSITLQGPGQGVGGGAGNGSLVPTAAFTVSPASPASGSSATFDASTSTASAGATLVGYAWTFGDAATATGRLATHTYAAAGTYTVSVTVTDSKNQTATASQSVTVTQGNTAPTANFTVSADTLKIGAAGTFDASTSSDPENGTLSYAWDFGDQTALVHGATATHAFDAAGSYPVQLIVTDPGALADTAVRTVVVVPGPVPVIDSVFLSATTVAEGSTVTLIGYATIADSTIPSYTWTGLGNAASFSASTQEVHAVLPVGTDSIRLRASAGGSAADTIIVVSVAAKPVAAFTVSPDTIRTGDAVTVNGSTSQVATGHTLTYRWNFGTGNPADTAVGVQATFAGYATAGTKTITLTVTDDLGQTATTTQSISVRDRPTANFSFSPSAPTATDTVTFTDGSTTPTGDTLTAWAWDFGDFSTASGRTAKHVYGTTGTFTAQLTVTDQYGTTDRITKSVTVASQPVSGMVGWFKADAGVSTNGTAVTAWANQGSSTVSFAQDADVSHPATLNATGINGKPALQFGGAATNFVLRTPSGLLSSDVGTIFIVWTLGASDHQYALGFDNWDQYTSDGWPTYVGAYNLSHAFYDNALQLSSRTLSTGVPMVTTFAKNGGTDSLFYNGTLDKVVSQGLSGHITSKLALGWTKPYSKPFNGLIAEILIYPTVLSATDRQTTEAYLKAKYSITP